LQPSRLRASAVGSRVGGLVHAPGDLSRCR
jgi:hypothetical protein